MFINTTLHNITILYFQIELLEWITFFDEMGDSFNFFDDILFDDSNLNLNFSGSVNPFSYGIDVGCLMLVNINLWQVAPTEK